MDTRFRVRTQDGREFSPSTLEDFAYLVSSHQITADDQVFDALTGEWTPAASHSVYHLVTDPLLEGESSGGESAVERAEGDGATETPAAEAEAAAVAGVETPGETPVTARPGESASVAPLDLSLAEASSPTPDEEAAAFLARMEQERADDPDEPALARELDLTGGDVRSEVGSDPAPSPIPSRPGVAEPDPAAPLVLRRSRPRGPKRPLSAGVAGEPFRGPDGWAAAPQDRRVHRRRLLGIAAVMLMVAASGVWLATSRGGGWLATVMPARTSAEAPPARVPRTSNATVRAAAWDDFVDRVEAMRREMGVLTLPAGWLEGRYLSDARSRPEMLEFWTAYVDFVERLHGAEVDVYRDAYLAQLDVAGVSGPVRSLRMAAATVDFQTEQPAREVVYLRAWELATAAVELHELLVDLDGRITYEPARSERVSADPVLEAAGTDEDAQARLDAALDRILDALHGLDGERTDVRAVPTWVPAGLERLAPSRVE